MRKKEFKGVICGTPLANDWIEEQERKEDPIGYAERKKKFNDFQQQVLENIRKNNRTQTRLKIVLVTIGVLILVFLLAN